MVGLSGFDLQRCEGSGDACVCARRDVTGAVTPPPLPSTQEDGVCGTYMYIIRHFSAADNRTRVTARPRETTSSLHKTRDVRAILKVSISRYWLRISSALQCISCNNYFLSAPCTVIENKSDVKTCILLERSSQGG
jgi:hypothetical protein